MVVWSLVIAVILGLLLAYSVRSTEPYHTRSDSFACSCVYNIHVMYMLCACAHLYLLIRIIVWGGQVNYHKASPKKWDLSMVPKDLDSPDMVQAEGEGNGSLHERLSTHLEAGNRNPHNGSNVKADRDFFTLKSDVVCGLVLGVHMSL